MTPAHCAPLNMIVSHSLVHVSSDCLQSAGSRPPSDAELRLDTWVTSALLFAQLNHVAVYYAMHWLIFTTLQALPQVFSTYQIAWQISWIVLFF